MTKISLSASTIAQDSTDGKIGQVTTDVPVASLQVDDVARFAIQGGWLIALNPKALSVTRTIQPTITAKDAKGKIVATLKQKITVTKASSTGGGGGAGGGGSALPPLDATLNRLRMTAPVTALGATPVWIGRGFLQGKVKNLPSFAGGLPTIARNVTNRFPDGSVAFAWMKTVVPSLALGSSIALDIQDSTAAPGTPLTQAEMLDDRYDFDAKLLIDGALAVSARQMLIDGKYRMLDEVTALIEHELAGTDYDFGGPLRSCHPVFYAAFYPTGQVEVTPCSFSTNNQTLQDVKGDVEIIVGNKRPQSVLKQAAVNMPFATSWQRTFWINGAPGKFNLEHNVGYLASTHYIPNQDPTLRFAESDIAANYAGWLSHPHGLHEPGMWAKGMGQTGARKDICLTPGWMAQYLYTGDWRDLEVMEGMALLAGAWRIQVTEGADGLFFDAEKAIPAKGRVISPHARPTDQVFANLKTFIMHSPLTNVDGFSYQIMHSPAAFTLPYTLTGRPIYLRLLQNWTGTCAMDEGINANSNQAPYYSTTRRTISPDLIMGFASEFRGEAWHRRDCADAGFLSPDGSPERKLFIKLTVDGIAVEEGMKGIKSALSTTPAWIYGATKVMHATKGGAITFSPLNYGYVQPVGDSNVNRSSNEGMCKHGRTEFGAVYQQGFGTGVLGRLVELGYPAQALFSWHFKFYTKPVTEGYPVGSDEWKIVGSYAIPLRKGRFPDDAGVTTGTPDDIHVAYAQPVTALVDRMVIGFRVIDAPLTLTPMVSPGIGLPSYVITKAGGKSLDTKDIPAPSGSDPFTEVMVRFHKATTSTDTDRWELEPMGGSGPYFQDIAEMRAEWEPGVWTSTINTYFAGFGGNFTTITLGALSFGTQEPGGQEMYDFYNANVRGRAQYLHFALGSETGWDLIPRLPSDLPLPALS